MEVSIWKIIAIRIIKEQELIIGPIAWDEAGKVEGLKFSIDHSDISFDDEDPIVVDRLVSQFERLFGRASTEVCREAVRDIIGQVPTDKMPSSLK